MLLHMRTSIDIPDPLLRRARKLARERGTSLRALLLDGLQRTVAGSATSKAHRMKDLSFGKGGLDEGLSWSDTERIDAIAYGDRG
jgi:hypothetical protein